MPTAAAITPESGFATDETGLAVYDFPAQGPVRGAFYLLHGYGEHVGRYRRLIDHLNQRGWHVGAHDHRGHGHSAGARGRLPKAPGLADDAIRRLRAFAQRRGGLPVLFGHSMGGVLAAELVLQRAEPVAALALSSPALRPSLTRFQQFQLRLMHAIAPRLVLSRPVDGVRLSHDAAQVRAYLEDPLVHGSVTAEMVQWMQVSGAASVANASGLAVPTLLIGGAGDKVADPRAWRAFAQSAPPRHLQAVVLDGALHELFNESPQWREPALTALDAWLASLTLDHACAAA
ncbi:MAG: alpha/beta hydrolase [Burkholderiaceae bacterium]